jgi:hypothetical protein
MKDKSSRDDHPNGNDPTPQPFTRKKAKANYR